MSEQEARLLLSACRRGEVDLADPLFAEALDQAAREPALAQWWAEQQALDAIFTDKLNKLSGPNTLPAPPRQDLGAKAP